MNFELAFEKIIWSAEYNIKMFYEDLRKYKRISLQMIGSLHEDWWLLRTLKTYGISTDKSEKLIRELAFIDDEYNDRRKRAKYGYEVWMI